MANKPVQQITLTFAIVFALGFLLNFVWEAVFIGVSAEGASIRADVLVKGVTQTSLTNAFIIIILYFVIVLFVRNVLWIKEINMRHTAGYTFLAIVSAAIIHYKEPFLLLSDESPAEALNLVIGIGIFPIVQLAVTGMIALVVTQHMLHLEGIFYKLDKGELIEE